MKEISKIKKQVITLATSATLLAGSFIPIFETASSVQAAEQVQNAEIVRGVNFRTAPSLNSGKYGLVPKGVTVKVLEEVNSNWLKVNYKGKVGYISSLPRYVQYSGGQASSQEDRVTNKGSTTKQSWEKKADKIIQDGLKLKGTPYRFGAKAGSGYYDCSLFTQKVFSDNGIKLPRNSRQQYSYVDKIKKSDMRKGDLVFFDTKRDGRIDHVAIYMGDNKLLHTYKVGIGVTVSTINNYWESRYVGAGRVIK